jgi:hypothetical protein
MSSPPGTTKSPLFVPLAACCKQLDSSVGAFGTDTLMADTHTPRVLLVGGDHRYLSFLAELTALGSARDERAGIIKQELYNAGFNGQALTQKATGLLLGCRVVLYAASALKAKRAAEPPTIPERTRLRLAARRRPAGVGNETSGVSSEEWCTPSIREWPHCCSSHFRWASTTSGLPRHSG